MKHLSIFLSLSLVFITSLLPAQTETKWRFGVGAGVNSLRLRDAGGRANFAGIIVTEEKVSIQRTGNHFGFQANGCVSYYVNRYWRIHSGLGITYTRSLAYRMKELETTFLGLPAKSIYWDTLDQKYLLLEVPLYFRFYLVPPDSVKAPIKLFFDMGLIFQPPLVNRSTYSRLNDEGDYSSGKINLNIDPGSGYYLGFGFLVREKYTLVLCWSFLKNNREESIEAKSTLTKLTMTRFF